VSAVLLWLTLTGVGVWLIAGSHHHPQATRTTVTTRSARGAVAVSETGLSTLVSLGRTIYWAGPKAGYTYELTQRPDGRTYVRYLPAGTPVGSPQLFTTIGSYPIPVAYAVTRRASRQADAVPVPVPNGGVAFYQRRLPTNIYVAYPGSNSQIEVFDPSPARARQLVSSGAVEPVQGSSHDIGAPKTAATATDPAALAKLAARLGRPLYWAGSEPGMTYELSQTPDGRVYVRYLPQGVAVASAQPYLTVGTYPLANAFRTTKSAAKQKGSVMIAIPGGIAFYNSSRPTSVYVAFPGVNEQIEVFDPSAATVRSIVAHHLIRSVS